MSTEVRRYAFSVEEYHRMGEAGLFTERAGLFTERPKVELLDGEVVEMAPMGSRHAACLFRLDRVLQRLVGDRAIVSIQVPLHLDDRSEPEPDVALLRGPMERYDSAIPAAPDAFLVIEVSDTTLDYDRDVKAGHYARAGIPECWVIDLNAREILVSRFPSQIGYADIYRRHPGEVLDMPGLSDCVIAVDDLLEPL